MERRNEMKLEFEALSVNEGLIPVIRISFCCILLQYKYPLSFNTSLSILAYSSHIAANSLLMSSINLLLIIIQR